MQHALIDGQRRPAAPGLRGTCPGCGGPVIAKCGTILVWHWAHEAADCDPWSEPESAWHLGWKAAFSRSRTEVVIGPHRADVVTPRDIVVELQHSPISPEEIEEREQFYDRMVWLFDGRAYRKHFEMRRKGDVHTFRWKHPRKSVWTCEKTVFLDFGPEGVFALRRVYPKIPCGGWGEWLSPQQFISRLEGLCLR